MRDSFIPSLKDDLDRLAYEITTKVNDQHKLGAGLDSISGRNFFVDPPNLVPTPPDDPWLDAARGMAVELTDSNHVAAAQAPTPPATIAIGDNRNALIISNIGETPLIGTDTFNSYYGKITSRVGIESNQNQLSLEGAQDAVVQLENLRDGLSGVSLEEEMISLIVYQRGFESSAKFLSTVDDMMNTLINFRS